MRHLADVVLLAIAITTPPARGQDPVAAPAPPTAAPGRALDDLWSLPLTGSRHRASSWNQTGANGDFVAVKPGERVAPLRRRGVSGSIRRIWMTINSNDPEYLSATTLRFTFDGRVTADDVPLGMLAATGPWRVGDVVSPVANVMRSRPRDEDDPGVGRGSFNLLWTMPFAESVEIEIRNGTKEPLSLFFYVDYLLHPVAPRPLWFHATHRREHPTRPADPNEKAAVGEKDYVFADIKAMEGRYVGTVLAVESHPSRPGKWYEGDDRFLIDGRELLHGTGTEDYFGMAWGFHRVYLGHDHGCSCVERGLTKEDRFYDGRFVAYRWHLNDPIVFRRSLRASIEAGHANECAQHYESVALWYGRPSESKNE
ncbi:MAG: DUF2961 domain-containing protein [Pirellulales bacterium]|nr:DUF2961 domain-containing protein [Pirellulales bacterium]